MATALVVYFSRTGYTARVAREIADRCGADLEAIDERGSRVGVFGYLRSLREAIGKATVEVQPANHDPANYDLLILGTPVWAGHVCSPLRSYVSLHKRWLARIAVFCTEGGSGGERVAAEIAELVGHAPLATLVVTDREIQNASYGTKLESFARALPPAASA